MKYSKIKIKNTPAGIIIDVQYMPAFTEKTKASLKIKVPCMRILPMDTLKKLFDREPIEEKSIVAMQINTHVRLWNRDIFISGERDGIFSQELHHLKAGEFVEQQMCIAAGLLEMGVEPGDRIAVFSTNSIRYAIAVFAIMAVGGVFVPIYPTSTEDEIENILRHSETDILFAGELPQYQKAISVFRKVKSPLRRMISMHYFDQKDTDVTGFAHLIETGARSGLKEEVVGILKTVSRDNIATLIYTPGSTGVSKGVPLSHGNYLAQKTIIKIFNMSDKDVRLAHLPFAHVFGLSADLFCSIVTGSRLCITKSFETEEVIRNLKKLQPTIICSVPRMYEKLCINVLHGAQQLSSFRRYLFNQAILAGREYYMCQCNGKHVRISTRLIRFLLFFIYKKLRKSLYLNNVRFMVSGGSPLPVEVSYFFGGIGLPIVEGYGLTETAPIININPPEKIKPGTVGPAIEGTEEKLSDEGEVLVKGPTVFRGYFKNPEEDALAFTKDGFFKTGDVGRFDEDGYLTITGRIKDLVITSSGKNIAPYHIEKLFENEAMITYICVVGDNRKYLTALIIPDFHNLRNFARENGISFRENEDLIKIEAIVEMYKERIAQTCSHLASHEKIKKFTLLPNEFSVKSGELSPTFKFRRHYVHEKYREIIDSMYPSSDSMKNGIM